ncbi:alpha/beta hydrolase [Methylocystis sp. ATCC 49242]|uniref:alpha/beta hydrolase n=1 Tax=Methylocystis sp. ATCC 49242 TaxID=622637 RepID=UPI0001F8885A|nr:dienelactone hydrolase family protein [Methylocystis sp. ATCC 49242]
MAAAIDGPRVQAKSGKPRQLVVFLHGYGADGNDLIEIGRQWRSFLPDADFVAPHAPERCAMSPMGRQWFPLTMRDQTERWRGCIAARPTLDAFLDAELEKRGLDERALALVGFSQGTMMALHTGLRRRVAPRAIVGYSGVLVLGPDQPGGERPHQEPPPAVLLAHGEEDEMIPVEALMMSANALADMNVPTQWHLSAGLGHGIDNAGLIHGALFLAQSFGVRVDFSPRGR